MTNSYRFFRNTECRYFPCHDTDDPDTFNCLFCFCPLYFLEDCGGTPKFRKGIKDCSACMRPHRPEGYDHVLKRLGREFEARRVQDD
jgi:Zn-finger protein